MPEKGEFPQGPINNKSEQLEKRNLPQYPLLDRKGYKNILYGVGLITHESNLVGSKNENGEEQKRPLAERKDRAEFLNKFKTTNDREEKRRILDEAKELDKIYVQFGQNQKEITINMDGLGEQMARYVILEPSVYSDKPPIILIPGISNDLYSIGELSIKLVASGRKVIMIAYPESWHGRVTRKFGDAVKQSDNFGPHTEFFKSAINKLVEGNNQIDLWGDSTGSLIVSNLLADNNFKQRIDNSVLLVPPGEITHKNFNISMTKETLSGLKKLHLMTKMSVSNREEIWTSDEHRELMLHTFNSLRDKVISRYPWWERNLLTGSGNKTVVIIGEKDHVTEAKRGKKEIVSNETLELYSIKSGNHSTPAVESEMVIDLVNKLQRAS